MVGMIKQSVLKQIKKEEGVGKRQNSIYIGEMRDIIIIVIFVLSYLPYVIFSNLIYLTYLIKLKHLRLDDNKLLKR